MIFLVGSSGLEPPTSRLSAECSNQLSYKPVCLSVFRVSLDFTFCRPLLSTGGDEGNRTLDPLLAGQVLSQLSYTPICEWDFPTVPENRTTTELELCLRRLFCFFASFEKSYLNFSCSP